ncbi:hypothetical protein JTB14_018320 [Gonioctena quinquepunctata]|nr:hypothetical protein JTB14_018320 [Gonioctena quinquepunctata]
METNQGEILEESVSPTIAPEAILEIVNDEHEQNEQPNKKFEESFSTSTASEALSEIRKINLIEIPNKNQETDGTEYKRNVFPLSDIDGELVATTSRKRFSESNESAPKKRINIECIAYGICKGIIRSYAEKICWAQIFTRIKTICINFKFLFH